MKTRNPINHQEDTELIATPSEHAAEVIKSDETDPTTDLNEFIRRTKLQNKILRQLTDSLQNKHKSPDDLTHGVSKKDNKPESNQ
jgi:hypothetical protein